jgi:hypothetical protein
VYAKAFKEGRPNGWLPGIVGTRLGHVLYEIQVEGQVLVRHINQLKRRGGPAQGPDGCVFWWERETAENSSSTPIAETERTSGRLGNSA